jgi:hypothetical protein
MLKYYFWAFYIVHLYPESWEIVVQSCSETRLKAVQELPELLKLGIKATEQQCPARGAT